MKKGKLVFAAMVVASVFASSAIHAQSVNGKNYLNAGIGIGTYGLYGSGGLPVTASFEHGFTDKISAGVFAGLIQRKYEDDWNYNYKVIGVRGSYHFNELLKVTEPKLDVYGGVSLYHRSYTLKYDEGGTKYKYTDGVISIGIHAAARYMFAEKVGAYAELGYGISPLQLGAAFVF